MSPDVQKAAASLAAGRRDEARVYAWNALSSATGEELLELRGLADALDDPELLRELDRRGVPAAAPPAMPAEFRSSTARVRRMVGPILSAAVVLTLIAVAVAEVPTEGGPLHASRKNTIRQTEASRVSTLGPGVYLVPLGHVSRVDVPALAGEVTRRYRIRTTALPALPLPDWTLADNEKELDADRLIQLLETTYLARGRAAIVGITDFDMLSPSIHMDHMFSLRNPPPYCVVSSSRLGATLFDRLRGHGRHERVRKLVARNIGFLYLQRPESSDPHSLLRSSMSSVHDIDALDEHL
jgi:hypothetical protein